MGMMKRGTAILLAMLLITAYASPLTTMAQEDMVIFDFPWPYEEAPVFVLEEEAFPHDAHIQAFNDFKYFDIHEVTMASFEPFVLGAGGAMMQALKQAMPSMIMEAGGFGIGSDNAGDFMQAVMSMPIFCRQTWRDFGTFAFDLATEAGRSMQNTFNMVTDGLAIENRIRLRNPQTGEQRYGWSIPMHEVQTIFNALQQPLAEFIGPINLTEVDAAWAAGVPFLHNRPATLIYGDLLIGFYHGVPIFRWDSRVPNWNGRVSEITAQIGAIRAVVNNGNVVHEIRQIYGGKARYRNNTRIQNVPLDTRLAIVIQAQSTNLLMRGAGFSTAIEYNIRMGEIQSPPITPALDVFIGPQNIVTNPSLAAAHVGQVAGVQSDEDEVFFWWPNSLPEFLEMLEAARGAESVVVPQGWQVADDDDPPIIYPPLYPPITHPQNPAIPREWLENVERELAGIHSYAGAIAGTLAAEGNVDFNRYRGNRNLTTIFPFSIPFSFGRAISSLRAPPQAPRFEADFTGTVFDSNTIAQAHGIPTSGAGGFVLTLDLEEFESLAVIIRWGVWITFFVGLMLLTNKLIRW